MALKFTSIFVAAALATTTAASAQSVSAAYPESIAAALLKGGYKAEITTDSAGDPLIKSAASGWNYQIVFYGCEDNRACQDVMFAAGFDMENGMAIKSINSWNENKLLGRAYLDDEDDPHLVHFVAGMDGMPAPAFERLIERWETSLGEFAEYIGW
ncbi:MAG: YbjN domain-containing protein [Roseovarius sp.]|nr:YbjN domain-containing protein [Roseovarius sp.]